MPLKHSTETILVGLLGAVMAIAGISIAVLSYIASPGFPWIGGFLVSLAYPLLLYPHFRDRRADYEFRLLHFAPAFILLLWLILTMSVRFIPFLGTVLGMLTFAWAMPLVALGFLLLAWFCVSVLRQWTKRMAILAVIFVPFIVLGLTSEMRGWDRELAMVITGQSDGGAASSRPAVAVNSAIQGAGVTAGFRSSARAVSSRPPSLPHAGVGLELFALMVPAATCTAVQLRAMRRRVG